MERNFIFACCCVCCFRLTVPSVFPSLSHIPTSPPPLPPLWFTCLQHVQMRSRDRHGLYNMPATGMHRRCLHVLFLLYCLSVGSNRVWHYNRSNTGNVLYCLIRMCVRLWTGLSWLGIGSSDGLFLKTVKDFCVS